MSPARLRDQADLGPRCLDDVDDEVRDRAALYLQVIKDEPLGETLVKDGQSFTARSG